MSTPKQSSDNYDMSNSYTESQKKSAVRSTYTMSINAHSNKFHSKMLAILSILLSKCVHIDVRCTYIFF